MSPRDFDRFNASREAVEMGRQLGGRRVFVLCSPGDVPIVYLEHVSGRLRRPYFRLEPGKTVWDGMYGNKTWERAAVQALYRDEQAEKKAARDAETSLLRRDFRRDARRVRMKNPHGTAGVLEDMLRTGRR